MLFAFRISYPNLKHGCIPWAGDHEAASHCSGELIRCLCGSWRRDMYHLWEVSPTSSLRHGVVTWIRPDLSGRGEGSQPCHAGCCHQVPVPRFPSPGSYPQFSPPLAEPCVDALLTHKQGPPRLPNLTLLIPGHPTYSCFLLDRGKPSTPHASSETLGSSPGK